MPIVKDTIKDDELVQELKELNKNLQISNYKAGFWYNFWRAAIGALGATIGVTVMLSLILWLLSLFSFIPGASSISNSIQNFIPSKVSKTQ